MVYYSYYYQTWYISWSCLKEILNETQAKMLKFPISPKAIEMPASITEIQLKQKENLVDDSLPYGYQLHS